MTRHFTSILLLLLILCCKVKAQHIAGTVEDRDDHKALGNVSVTNVYTNETTICDSLGHFKIRAANGQLIEMRKPGYSTTRVRIPQGNIPPFFRIMMLRITVLSGDAYAFTDLNDFQKDSIRNSQLYKTALEFPKMTGLDMIQHPFSAMSKSNREKWAFQEHYIYFEQEKFIDYTFNEQLISGLTGLKGDSLKVYMKHYRPGYEKLRSLKEYDFYNYIKRTVDFYRKSGKSGSRSSG